MCLPITISPIAFLSPCFNEYILRMLCNISAITGCDDIIPAVKPTAERPLPSENGRMSTSEKTSIIHVIVPIQGVKEGSVELDLPGI